MAIHLPDNPRLAAKVIDAEAQNSARRTERGIMGVLFGVAKEKPGNIAGFVIIISCLMIIHLARIASDPELPKRELITLFASLIQGALGYVFGSIKSGD